jgi:hypothetical protein
LKFAACSFLVVFAVHPLFAQSSTSPTGQPTDRGTPPAVAEPPKPSPFNSFIELQYYNIGNFFQVPSTQHARTVNALGATYRLTMTRPGLKPDLYGSISVMRYSGNASETSYTGQIGVNKYSGKHWYDVSVDYTRNGYSFDIEETRVAANIASLWASYSYEIANDWRIGAETYDDRQRFNINTGFESDYYSLSGVVRYSGFGDILKPRAGYTVGHRDSRDENDDLDDRYWYVQLATEPVNDLEFSVRYRDRMIDYENTTREDDRTTWQFRVNWRQNTRVRWVGTYRIESVDTTRVGRDFDRNSASVTMTYGF